MTKRSPLSRAAKFLLLGGALVFAAAGPVLATPVNGTINIVALGTTSNLANLVIGDTLTNSGVEFGAGGTGQLSVITPGTAISDTSLTASNGSSYDWTSAAGNFVGSVHGTPVIIQNSPSSTTMNVYVLGTFTPLGILSAYSPGPMSETIGYTETQNSGSTTITTSFSFSGTGASPPTAEVPEPATFGMLLVGLLGLGLVHRRHLAG